MTEETPVTLSTSHAPDLDWSQIRETVAMLTLSVARIEYAMKDGNDSVDTLTEWFTAMVGNAQVINAAAQNLPEGETRETILSNCQAVDEKVQSAIVAFQFYDKFTQRLSHISVILRSLSEIVSDASRVYNPNEWSSLQVMIKSKYTLDADQRMFEAILAGKSVDEVLKEAVKIEQKKETSDVELF